MALSFEEDGCILRVDDVHTVIVANFFSVIKKKKHKQLVNVAFQLLVLGNVALHMEIF